MESLADEDAADAAVLAEETSAAENGRDQAYQPPPPRTATAPQAKATRFMDIALLSARISNCYTAVRDQAEIASQQKRHPLQQNGATARRSAGRSRMTGQK